MLGIILVEEIYKFFRYRLNLEFLSLLRRYTLVSVWIHFCGLSFTGHDLYSVGLLASQDPSGQFLSPFVKACSLAQQSASLRPWVTQFCRGICNQKLSLTGKIRHKRTVYQISVDQANRDRLCYWQNCHRGSILLVHPIGKSRGLILQVFGVTICPLCWSLALIWFWWTSRWKLHGETETEGKNKCTIGLFDWFGWHCLQGKSPIP